MLISLTGRLCIAMGTYFVRASKILAQVAGSFSQGRPTHSEGTAIQLTAYVLAIVKANYYSI
jgi:hypothetical protein